MVDSGALFHHPEAQLCSSLGQWPRHTCYVISTGFFLPTTLGFCYKALTTEWFVIAELLVMAYKQFLFCVFFNCRAVYEHWVLYVNFISLKTESQTNKQNNQTNTHTHTQKSIYKPNINKEVKIHLEWKEKAS